MSTILIVSGSYYPYATANAVCVKKFEDVLRAKGHEVLYCNRKHDLYEPDHHIYDGTELYTVGKNSDLFFQTMEKVRQLDMPNHMGRSFKWAFSLFRFMMRLFNLGSDNSTLRCRSDKHYMETYSSAISDIIENRKVDLVLSVSMPFDSHRAAQMAMRGLNKRKGAKRPRWIVYCIDAFWSKAGVKPGDVKKMQETEKSIFADCDGILFLDTIAPDYKGAEYDVFRKKMFSLPLPLFDLNNISHYDDGIDTPSGLQHWLFAGTIYDDFRNAECISEVIRLQKSRPVRIHMMGKFYPKSLAMLQEVQAMMPDQLMIYGRQSYEFAKGSMEKADILINLANDNTNQIPSKIFEYMAYLKPVLNIYRNNDDVGTGFLRKYPLAFNLSTEDIVNQMGALIEWSQTVGGKTVTHDDLRYLFKDLLSESVTERFYSMVEPLLER